MPSRASHRPKSCLRLPTFAVCRQRSLCVHQEGRRRPHSLGARGKFHPLMPGGHVKGRLPGSTREPDLTGSPFQRYRASAPLGGLSSSVPAAARRGRDRAPTPQRRIQQTPPACGARARTARGRVAEGRGVALPRTQDGRADRAQKSRFGTTDALSGVSGGVVLVSVGEGVLVLRRGHAGTASPTKGRANALAAPAANALPAPVQVAVTAR